MPKVWLCYNDCWDCHEVCRVYSEKYQAEIWLSQAEAKMIDRDELGITYTDKGQSFRIEEREVI